MEVISAIFDIIGLIVFFLGMVVFFFEIIGIFKYRFLLNRMHAAGMGDTLGIMLCLIGTMLMNGLQFSTLKILLIIVFLWFSSPTASHLIARLEAVTDEEVSEHVDVRCEVEE